MEFAAGDVNLYRYVYNNSVNSVDPTGFFPTGKDKWWGHNDPNFHWWWHNCYWKGEPYDDERRRRDSMGAMEWPWPSAKREMRGQQPCPNRARSRAGA